MTKAELIKVIFTPNELNGNIHVKRAQRLKKDFCVEVRRMYDESPNGRCSAKNTTRKFFDANARFNKYH